MTWFQSHHAIPSRRTVFGLSYVATLGIFVLTAGLSGFGIVSTIGEQFSMADTLAQYARKQATLDLRQAQDKPMNQIFIPGPSASITRAELLKHVSNEIMSESGTILSSSLDEAAISRGEGANTIKIRTTFRVDNDHLQRLLYRLESEVPFLFVDSIVVRSSSDSRGMLQAEMTISGLWRGPQS